MRLATSVLFFAMFACNDTVEVTARRYEVAGDCFRSPARVGTIEHGATCDDVIVYAADGSGACFQFPNGCLPSGFEVRGYDATACGSPDVDAHACE
jgi:hypothetical protein